jgi:hypothetical protein
MREKYFSGRRLIPLNRSPPARGEAGRHEGRWQWERFTRLSQDCGHVFSQIEIRKLV